MYCQPFMQKHAVQLSGNYMQKNKPEISGLKKQGLVLIIRGYTEAEGIVINHNCKKSAKSNLNMYVCIYYHFMNCQSNAY
jgi:hypothetical protein